MTVENLDALRQAKDAYEQILTNKAEKCSELIKTISKEFTDLGIPEVNTSWTEEVLGQYGEPEYNLNLGLTWNPDSGKILFWVDDPTETEVLAGCGRFTRAQCLPHITELVHTATVVMENKTNALEEL